MVNGFPRHLPGPARRLLGAALAAFLLQAVPCAAQGDAAPRVGMTEIPASAQDGPILVFHPTDSAPQTVRRGLFTVQVAEQARILPGNGRLIVISHGSGAHPMVQADIALDLVRAGFLVAIPEHAGDNWHDRARVGPASWERRPAEVSRAIDALAQDNRFAPLFDATRVGVHGMSAGGHTALTLAGGRWSRALLLAHCEDHLADDFIACTGAATELRGNLWDPLKLGVARLLIRWNLRQDATWHSHTDPRIRAAVSGVPFAADFDPESLRTPVIPLGIVQAEQDRWLVPRFHSATLLARCSVCTLVASLPRGGHGALLSPLPPEDGLIGRLVADPPGFERDQLPTLHARIAAFFRQHLLP